MYLSLESTSLCFHTLFFFNQSVLFVYSISFYFSLFQSNHKRTEENLTFNENVSFFLSLFFSLGVVCLTKQHYKSNSAAVNRLQNWLSPASSPRSGRIINTDLYCSLLANTHMPIWRLPVGREATPGTLQCFYYEVLRVLWVERRPGWGAATAVVRNNSLKKGV